MTSSGLNAAQASQSLDATNFMKSRRLLFNPRPWPNDAPEHEESELLSPTEFISSCRSQQRWQVGFGPRWQRLEPQLEWPLFALADPYFRKHFASQRPLDPWFVAYLAMIQSNQEIQPDQRDWGSEHQLRRAEVKESESKSMKDMRC